jgi:MazG family protein
VRRGFFTLAKEIAVDALAELLTTLRRLREPDGCPWDRKQSLADWCGYLLDETYEFQDVLAQPDSPAVTDELGDVLFVALSCALWLEEQGHPGVEAAAAAARDKIVRRHPHVFGDRSARTAEEGLQHWRAAKAEEARARGEEAPAFLQTPPRSMPALRRAVATQRRVAEVGFEWETAPQVWAKVLEEGRELHEAFTLENRARLTDELGDLLFSVVNLARFLDVDPEAALNGTVAKFSARFAHVERALRARGRSLHDASLAEMDELWEAAKNPPPA